MQGLLFCCCVRRGWMGDGRGQYTHPAHRCCSRTDIPFPRANRCKAGTSRPAPSPLPLFLLILAIIFSSPPSRTLLLCRASSLWPGSFEACAAAARPSRPAADGVPLRVFPKEGRARRGGMGRFALHRVCALAVVGQCSCIWSL